MLAKKDRGKFDDTIAAMFSNPEFSNSYLFYAHMIGQCSVKVDNDLPAPAGVSFRLDHYNLYVNPKEFSAYDLCERLAILKHEMLHVLEGHLLRFKDLPGSDNDFQRWNLATDCAINQHIDETHLPESGVTPETLKKHRGVEVPPNQSSETYYDLLESEFDSSEGKGCRPGDPARRMDSHETWKTSEGDPDLQKDVTKKMIEKAQEETIKGRGRSPCDVSRWMEMFSRKAELNWKKVLRGVVGNKRVSTRRTIMREDRRLPHREDLKGKVKDRTFNLLVVADVSGSMSDEAVIRTLAEVRHTCEVTKTSVDMIQVDTEAFDPQKLSKTTRVFHRKGSGGTYLSTALNKAKEHRLDFQAVVVLTDGGLSGKDVQRFRDLRKKVIWLVDASGYVPDSMNTGRMKAFKISEGA